MPSDASPVILIVGHVIPYPPAAGNEIRILKLVRWLRSHGYRVVMLFNHEQVSEERRSELQDVLGPVHFIDDGGPASVEPASKRPRPGLMEGLAYSLPDSVMYRRIFGLGKAKKLEANRLRRWFASDRLIGMTGSLCDRYRPVAVIAEYIFTAPCLDVLPAGTLKMIDTHDVFSRKKAEVISHGIEDLLACSPREERGYLEKADVAIAIQSNEALLLAGLVPTRDVITVGIDFDVVAEPSVNGLVPGTVLVVGSDNPLNQHGLKAFLEHAWPSIRASRTDAVLRVAGKLADHAPADLESIQRVGWVPDLNDEYRRAAVVINPTQAGTGLKIKSVEALCRGKALIGTPNSVEGLEAGSEAPYVACREWRPFAEAVTRLLGQEDERRRLERAAVRFARAHFSTEATYAPLEACLRRAVPSRSR